MKFTKNKKQKIPHTVFNRKSASLALQPPPPTTTPPSFGVKYLMSISLEWAPLFSLRKTLIWKIVFKEDAHLGIT